MVSFYRIKGGVLRSMKLGELSIDAYFHKIESIATIISSLGSPISNDDVVNIALGKLPDKYQHVSDIIIHRDPFLDLKMVCSMLNTLEMCLKSRAQASYVDSTSSSPIVLLANSGTNTWRSTPFMDKVYKPCFNFNKGSCRFGEYCKFLHNKVHGNSSTSVKTPTNVKNDDMGTLQTLMAKLDFDSNILSFVSNNKNATRPIALYTTTTGPTQTYAASHSLPWFPHYQTQSFNPSGLLGLLGQHPCQPGHLGLMGQPVRQYYQMGQNLVRRDTQVNRWSTGSA
ncbi:hybrid signal transduction histidine kinase M [Tanacetum coccineum]